MWRCIFVIFIVFIWPHRAITQVITTIAGTGVIANTGDGGPASAASINYPSGIIFDKEGNLYVALGNAGNKIRKISPSGIITTVAGTGVAGYSGDGGQATNAQLKNAPNITVDTLGNVYISDAENNVIRKVDKITGIITTIAGTGVVGHSGDGGPATAAKLYNPNGICFDKLGNLYFGDNGNFCVRKINSAGIISHVAGNGTPGYSGDNGMADTSAIYGAFGLCFDSIGNLYIADGHTRVCQVTLSGLIVTFAGSSLSGSSGDGGPATNARIHPLRIAFDQAGNLYISQYAPENTVRVVDANDIIHTVAGNGASTFSGDGGPATAASIYYPAGVAVDSCGNLFISDLNSRRIRKVAFNPECWALGIKKAKQYNVNIYPNPATDELHIDGAKHEQRYKVYDIVGSVMQQGALHEGNNIIPIGELPIGMYMVVVNDREGRKNVVRLIKQ